MALDETILLHFDIDEQPAVNSIKDLRTANSQLRAERDKVNISTKEGQELVQKLNVSIDKNNKLIKDNSSALEKQRQNVGNYSKSIQEAAGELNIMGTNVGQVGTKLASFANPATAAVAIVGALGAAYARSTAGAKDLEFVQGQLSVTTTLITNAFADMITSAEDGDGALTKLFNAALRSLGPAGVALSETSKALTLAQKAIEDLGRTEIDIRGNISERLGENQEFLTEINNEQTTLNRKLELTKKIEDNINTNANELLVIKAQQLKSAESILKADSNNEEKQRNVKILGREIDKIELDRSKKLKANGVLTDNIKTAENKRLETLRKQNEVLETQTSELERQKRIRDLETELAGPQPLSGTPNPIQIEEIKLSQKSLDVFVEGEKKKAEAYKKRVEIQKALQEQELGAARDLAGTLASLAEEGSETQKALALVTIGLNTGIGVSEAVKAGAGVPWPANLAAILSGITAVLAGVAQAKQALGFAEGGWTGPGSKYKAVGVVHADEYVTPKRIVNNPAAQPHLRALESMRTGYADGGFVTNSNLQSSQQAMIMANAIKNLPTPVVSWTEGQVVGKRVEWKQNITRK